MGIYIHYIHEDFGLGEYCQDMGATSGHSIKNKVHTFSCVLLKVKENMATFRVYISRLPNIEIDVPLSKHVPWHMDVLLTFSTSTPD